MNKPENRSWGIAVFGRDSALRCLRPRSAAGTNGAEPQGFAKALPRLNGAVTAQRAVPTCVGFQDKRCFRSAWVLSLFLATAVLAENTAVIPAPRTTVPTNWMSSHESFVQQAKRGNIDLLFLGDSIIAGWLWGNGGLNIWNKCYVPRRAAEFGIGYDRTQNVLWRIKHGELDGIKPKVVVLLIGTNNCGNEDDGKPRNTTPEIIEGVTAIVRELRTRLPDSKILLFGIFPRGEKSDPVRVQVKAVNAGIAKLDDGKMVKFMDIGSKLLEPDGTLSRDIMPDLLHPNEKGYQIWSDAMESTLAQMLK